MSNANIFLMRNGGRTTQTNRRLDRCRPWCRWFQYADLKTMAEESLLYWHNHRYDIIAWAIMPNHIHVLLRPHESHSLSRTVASWKQFMSSRIRSWTKQEGVACHTPMWHREYWDRYIRDEEHWWSVIKYIHHNPVKAGLSSRAEDWLWSSARWWNQDSGKASW